MEKEQFELSLKEVQGLMERRVYDIQWKNLHSEERKKERAGQQ